MEKTNLQLRAEDACKRFCSEARKPIVLEFAGVPKAGKTSTITQVQTFLKRCGFRVEVVVERASVCPIRDKKHSNFNVWTACTTLAQVLEKTQEPPRDEDPQILILDRGFFDAICWLRMMDRLSRIRSEDRVKIEEFLCIGQWRKLIAAVIVMTVSPDESMKREQGLLQVQASGSIMNHEVLEQMLNTTNKCAEEFAKLLRVHTIDTTPGRPNSTPEKTAQAVVEYVLGLIEDHVQEDILCLPKSAATQVFQKSPTIGAELARDVLAEFVAQRQFKPREEVECDAELVQALPVAIIRNRSGDVLLLKRREGDSDSVLHEKLVIWAGGHVRKEDAENGDPIELCVLRELQEELRLSVELSDLQLLGAVYVDANDRVSKHVCLVYEWKADTDDVAIALSKAEFFERRGRSLSGKFVSIDEVGKRIDSEEITEPWSVEIARHMLPGVAPGSTLF